MHKDRTSPLTRTVLILACSAALPLPALAGPDNWQAIMLHQPGVHSWAHGVSGQMQVGVINDRASVWHGVPGSTLLPIPGYTLSEARATDGTRIFGNASKPTSPSYTTHAMLWPGAGQDPINLNPAVARHSRIVAAAGDQQAGNAWLLGPQDNARAALWRGTAESYVNLHPAGAQQSYAFATDGVRQGGSVWTSTAISAALWNGTAASFVSLNPPGSTRAEVRGMADGVQVGSARMPGNANPQAALWRGSAETYINMNPSGASWSEILATSGQFHVGRAWLGGGSASAILWWGDEPDNYINLHNLLPGFYSSSTASGINIDGDTIYISGWGRYGPTQAALWIGTIPAPSSGIILALGLLAMGRRRR